MMKLVVVLMLMAVGADAKPYFRFVPFKQIQAAAFFPIAGGVEDISAGSKTPIFQHSSEDGYLLIPGVDWNLLDLGWVADTKSGKGSVAIGPSVDVAGPVKALVSKAVDLLPGAKEGGSYAALRWLLAPANDLTVSVGPAFVLTIGSRQEEFKGSLQMSAGLVKKFGGSK
jgi:hypothetical protein